jgi:hypothetical protein
MRRGVVPTAVAAVAWVLAPPGSASACLMTPPDPPPVAMAMPPPGPGLCEFALGMQLDLADLFPPPPGGAVCACGIELAVPATVGGARAIVMNTATNTQVAELAAFEFAPNATTTASLVDAFGTPIGAWYGFCDPLVLPFDPPVLGPDEALALVFDVTIDCDDRFGLLSCYRIAAGEGNPDCSVMTNGPHAVGLTEKLNATPEPASVALAAVGVVGVSARRVLRRRG